MISRRKAKYVTHVVLVFLCILLIYPHGLFAKSDNRNHAKLIFDESSIQLQSIFVGIPPSPDTMRYFLGSGSVPKMVSDTCPKKPNWRSIPILGHLLSWVRPLKVHASSCSRRSCKGFHTTSSYRHCGGDCDIWVGWFHTSQLAPWFMGYRNSGAPSCCGNRCREEGCYNA